MPGCGKSTFGRKVARELNMDFFDLDKAIIEEEGLPITDIFAQKGEDHFREVESRLLREISSTNENFLMATGGGAPCFFDNMDFMNEQGYTIYIDTPVETLMERLSFSGINKRPLLKNMGEENLFEGLTEKLNVRLPFYSQARIAFKYNVSLESDIIQYLRDAAGGQ